MTIGWRKLRTKRRVATGNQIHPSGTNICNSQGSLD